MKIEFTTYENSRLNTSTTQFQRRKSAAFRCKLIGLLAVLSATVFLSPPVFSATFRFATTSNRIYVEGGGSATLSDIRAALPHAPLDLVDPVNSIWLVRANLLVTDGSILELHGTSIGGDVNELRLLSNNNSTNA